MDVEEINFVTCFAYEGYYVYSVCVCAQSLNHVQLMQPTRLLLHGIFQARILDQFAVSYSRGSSQPRDLPSTGIEPTALLYHCATW